MYAKVLIEISNKSVDKEFIYIIPDNLKSYILVGIKVIVPFGKRLLEGFVLEILNSYNGPNIELKEIKKIVFEDVILNKELLELGKYISSKYLCSKISSYQLMLPKALKASYKTNINIKKDRFIVLNKKNNYINYRDNCSYPKQVEIINNLINNKEMKVDVLNSAIKTLYNNKIIDFIYKEVYRYNSLCKINNSNIILNDEQNNALSILKEQIKKNETFLLHGVTGSGKTEVYLNIISEVLKSKKEAILLVPEISLTPQMVNHIKSRFNDLVAVLHSGLTDTEKYDEYRKVQKGLVSIVVGARSAIFAPFNNLGIIIIDEEHVSSYKQDHNPRYHARDIAIFRSKYHNCPLILGSATPSLETYARAVNNNYKLIELKNRANNLSLPHVEIVDMKKEYRMGNYLFSKILFDKIKIALNSHKQILILLNRRGYSSMWTCSSCGQVIKCPKCDISLTYHKSSETFRCHYCGYGLKKQDKCLKCGSHDIKDFGIGTEKIEEEINKYFPYARVIRMDSDTTTKKSSYEKIINDFLEYKYDILVGTQMISKGLDFPLVTLVGVINADMNLNIPDFRSSENTFQLLSQVSGRAGRNIYPGEVIIQTYNPNHYAIQYAKNHDYLSFYKEEMTIRKKLKYVPYYYIVLIVISSKDYELCRNEANKVFNYLKNNLSNNFIVLGPSISNLFKINNVYHFQCIIKYQKKENLNDVLTFIDNMYKQNSKVNIDIDIDPLKL